VELVRQDRRRIAGGLAVWKDHFNYKSRPISYSDFNDPKLPIWAGRPGNKERIENLKWAREHCGGKFRVVIGVSKNIDAETRETIAAYETKMIMRIVEFNEATGELRAEMVDD
jgi:hypothetical protein